eukprot:1219865-Rhodomonas_salina.2
MAGIDAYAMPVPDTAQRENARYASTKRGGVGGRCAAPAARPRRPLPAHRVRRQYCQVCVGGGA